ncbi:MAG: hypothetical protein CMA34_07725 [Euryarchaeota archaeon]|nr:hypothetical protein [Euryarchaeota archaeon]|tara:strand:+ start:1356 stop:2147 length:792 start_codon:yes stop_codon:yes gene_type:complete
MTSKPWSKSSIGMVAGQFTDMRISGEVKEKLVDLLLEKLNQIVKEIEFETLDKDPSRKTLDDPRRERLGFSRTRGLILNQIKNVESVGASAVVCVNEELEKYLQQLVLLSSRAAAQNRVGTIKTRHLEKVLEEFDFQTTVENKSSVDGEELEKKDTISLNVGITNDTTSMKRLCKSLAGMPVSDECVEELLLLYSDYAEELEYKLKDALFGNNLHAIHENMKKLEDIRQLGFLRRMLRQAGEKAREEGAKKVEVGHVIQINPF